MSEQHPPSNFVRRSLNRFLHLIARNCPGGLSLRPMLHKWRGVKIYGKPWIGDDVYIDNEWPECIEIHDGVALSVKCIVLGHTKGPGTVILEKDCFIGPLAVIACTGGKVLRIGEGAVISAGCIITSSVPPHTIMAPQKASAVGYSRVRYYASSYEEFMGGLEPLRRRTPAAAPTPPPPKS